MGYLETPRVRFRVGLRCTSNVRDLWLLRGEHTSFSGTGSGDSHMMGSAETPTMPQQQADALALVAETALNRGLDPGARGERYQVVVHVDAPVLADTDAPGQSVLEDGTHVSYETLCPSRDCFDENDVVAQAFET